MIDKKAYHQVTFAYATFDRVRLSAVFRGSLHEGPLLENGRNFAKLASCA